MLKRYGLPDSSFIPVLFVLSAGMVITLFSCGTASSPADTLPQGELYFVPRDLPELNIPPDTGARSEDPADDSADDSGGLKSMFREAYAEALFRGVPLTGVLGSDRVNAWPAAAPESWSQNWAGSDTASNSWGIPGLVLALGDYHTVTGSPGGSPVYTVYGPVLDQYGKSGGLNRANGAAGYGVPLGELCFENGAAVQRFSKGRITVNREGTRFVPGEDTVISLLQSLSDEDRDAEFGGKNIPPGVSAAFARAWAFAGGARNSDGPVARLVFSKPWILRAGTEEIPVNGLYVKSYNQGADVFVLSDTSRLPLRAHRISGSILAVLLARRRLPGLEREQPLGGAGRGGSSLVQALVSSLAVYGPPLSDTLPWPAESEGEAAADNHGEKPLYLEAQRFARGWIIVTPKEPDEPEW